MGGLEGGSPRRSRPRHPWHLLGVTGEESRRISEEGRGVGRSPTVLPVQHRSARRGDEARPGTHSGRAPVRRWSTSFGSDRGQRTTARSTVRSPVIRASLKSLERLERRSDHGQDRLARVSGPTTTRRLCRRFGNGPRAATTAARGRAITSRQQGNGPRPQARARARGRGTTNDQQRNGRRPARTAA